MLYMRLFYPISIHAPTRGATNLLLLWPLPPEISIHAPTRGATQPYLHPVSLFRNFNPRSHEGSDDVTLKTPLLHSAISIHAPTRGATLQDCFEALLRIFQSTLPRGERLAVAGAFVKDLFISIHAPTRGATVFISVQIRILQLISIHAPTRGATAIFAKKFSFLSAKIV